MQATINGITLHYEDRGQGLPVLLIHAFPLSGMIWQPQVTALENDYRFIVPDLRGFGASSAPVGPYPMETYADDMVALLDTLGIEQAVLGGVSMGGYIIFAFLRRYAERVRALVLADTRSAADTEEIRAGRETNAQLAETEGASAMADVMLPKLLSPAASLELQAHVRSIIERNTPQGIAGALRGMGMRSAADDLLPSIHVPTLIVCGQEDTLTTPAEMKTMHTALPGSQFVEIAGAGHIANLEQPDAFTQVLDTFLKGLAQA